MNYHRLRGRPDASLSTLYMYEVVILILLAAAALNLESCAVYNIADFDSLEPGISIRQLTKTLGSPDGLVGEITTAYGQHVTVWEYDKLTSKLGEHSYFWVYIVDGHYKKYSLRGNWQKESQVLIRTDFSIPQPE